MKHKKSTMQKTWSILNESDSPNSASSTDANYSSPSGGNSSDDSNCSNQTNYSMSTGVMASPPATSTSSISSGDSPPPQQHQQQQQQPVPSTPAPQVTSKENNKENPPFTYVTTPQLAIQTLQRIKQRYCTPPDNNGNNSESAMRSLELLRMTIQSTFDKDIDVIVRRYIETYFQPAFINIKENLGDTAVSEEVLQKMSCALLENSKMQYHGIRMRPAQTYYLTTEATASFSNEQQNEQLQIRSGVKRHHMTSASSAASNTNATVNMINSPPLKRAFSSVGIRNQTTAAAAILATNVLPQTVSTERPVVNSSAPLPPSNFQPFRGTAMPNQSANATARRQIFWNTANVSTSTKFVLDVQANQAFGFGTDGRERLASKHPELIRYLPDADDRSWLIAQHIISQHNRNSRFLFLVHDEVCNLMQMHEVYRNSSNINLAMMRTFTVPESMIEKMRHFFVDLNIKSRGLITTSVSNSSTPLGGSSNSNNNATPNNADTSNTNAKPITISPSAFAGNPNSSQLRTALLQGQAIQPVTQLSLFNEDTLMSNASSDYVTTTSNLTDSPNVSNFSAAFQQPARTSALSSTHATLTALLNNSNSPGAPPPLSRVYAAYVTSNNNGRSSATATAAKTTTQTTSSAILNKKPSMHTNAIGQGKPNSANAAAGATATATPIRTNASVATISSSSNNNNNSRTIASQPNSSGTAAKTNNATISSTRSSTPQVSSNNVNNTNKNNGIASSASVNAVIPSRNPVRIARTTAIRK